MNCRTGYKHKWCSVDFYRGSCPSSGRNEHGQHQLTCVENGKFFFTKISVLKSIHAESKIGVQTVFTHKLQVILMVVVLDAVTLIDLC